jgi:dUTP pyrophosphatase
MFNLLFKEARVPTRATSGAAGFDLYALDDYELSDGQVIVVSTGVSVDIPSGHYAMVCSRSGIAAKYGVFVLNAPGIIDSDYKLEIKVILSKVPSGKNSVKFNINAGDRIAQLVFAQCDADMYPRMTADAVRVGGFGSTGM